MWPVGVRWVVPFRHHRSADRISRSSRIRAGSVMEGMMANPFHANHWTSGPPGSRTPISWLQGQASFRWTSSPSVHRKGPPENRTRSPSLPRRHAASTPADRSRLVSRVVPEGVEPPFPLCKTGVVAIGPRDVRDRSSSTGGSRTHRHQALESGRYASSRTVPSVRSSRRLSCGPGSRTTASERMKLGRAPAHPHVPGPGIEPGKPAL